MAVMSLRIYAAIMQNMKNAQAENLQDKLKEAYMPFMHFSKVHGSLRLDGRLVRADALVAGRIL